MADYGTSVDEVYDRALMMIEDYRIDKLATLNPSALSTYLRGLLINGISEFNLNDILGELVLVKKESDTTDTTATTTTTTDTTDSTATTTPTTSDNDSSTTTNENNVTSSDSNGDTIETEIEE